MTPRLYLPEVGAGGVFPLEAAKGRHLVTVLRMRRGMALTVFDGAGNAYEAVIEDDGGGGKGGGKMVGKGGNVMIRTAALLPATVADAGCRVHIGQALCAPAKMDWAVEKMTEIGAAAITPLVGESVKYQARAAQVERWRRLTIAACEQCGRNRLPLLAEPVRIDEWKPVGARVLLTPRAAEPLGVVCEAFEVDAPLTIAVGGESGFNVDEEALLEAQGFVPAHLGARVLRSETAALVVLAVLGVG